MNRRSLLKRLLCALGIAKFVSPTAAKAEQARTGRMRVVEFRPNDTGLAVCGVDDKALKDECLNQLLLCPAARGIRYGVSVGGEPNQLHCKRIFLTREFRVSSRRYPEGKAVSFGVCSEAFDVAWAMRDDGRHFAASVRDAMQELVYRMEGL